ncbi:FxSxx-COOH system tetratricopeptide repeat protein [Virgisporangium ochraceum]|uniref:Tetratricopeptide repeat protein n=1 Tax=Virgisporangium ochraceum TaxID=65505 RepID=A0A8J4EGW7_9ACTN|nr:tetratricopeptide repeat protein [Virgisporangium ochraceum]GIJ74334.1 tetratricopeptide repeat protein [Virgisporangium ochraceum]
MPPPQRVPEVAGVGVVHNLPLASAVFVGRDVDQVASLFGHGTGVVVGQAAVHGLGGIGKTELAVHYARAHLHRYRLVWWVTADTTANVGLGLAGLTRRMHPMATLTDAQEWAMGWLQSNTGWLLVLDNVEDIDHIRYLLGVVAGRGQVLVTTRRDYGAARWAKVGLASLRLGVLDRTASIDLLIRLTGQDDPDGAGRVAADLGDLPLALEQAAAYLGHHDGLTFDDYRDLLAARFTQMAADPGEGEPAHRSLARVWRVSIEAVTARSALAASVLAVLAWLAPDRLPADVLGPLADDPADLDRALTLLSSYSMITMAGGEVSVHRLVQAVTRTDSDDEPRSQAIQILDAAVPDDPIANVAGWPRWVALLPHIDAAVENMPPDHSDTTILHIADRAATFRQFQGQLGPAITGFEQVFADSRRVLGNDHPDTLTFRHNLAGAYEAAGRVREAIALHEQVLADSRRVLGDDHPSTLTSGHSLAYAYESAGRLDEAITLHERVLADYRRVLGDDHPHALTSRHNLAYAYESAGRVDEAIDLFEQVVADYRRVLGDDHPHALTSRHNLAGAYRSAGRVGEAITLYERVLADRRRVLGDDHPDTLTSRHNLAGAYASAGRVGEAITLYERVLADRRRVLGDDHPSTPTSRHSLAYAYQTAGRVGEAIDLYEQVVADYRRVLGDDHPHTLTAAENLRRARQSRPGPD